MPIKLTNEILSAAIEGFEAQKARIDARIAEIHSLLGGGRQEPIAPSETEQPETEQPKRKVSAAARRRMAKAQKLRWKRIKQGSADGESAAAKKGPQRTAAKKVVVKSSAKGPKKAARKATGKAQKPASVTEKAAAQAAAQ